MSVSLWLDVPQNSRGDDEPFISAASVITEACSHGHNHLLECLEIGSARKKKRTRTLGELLWYKAIGVGVAQGNFLSLSFLMPCR